MNDFEFLYGTWDVRHRRLRERLVQSTEWDEFLGTNVCAPILGGVGNFEQAWMPALGIIGSALRLFDSDAALWSIHWSSSATGRLDPPVRGIFADGVGVFVGEDQLRGAPIRVRLTWDLIAERSARWSQAFAPLDSTDWETNWVMEFTKVSDNAPAATLGA